MRFVIDISEYDKEWIGNAYCIPQDINTKIAEAIINAELYQSDSPWIPTSKRLPKIYEDVLLSYFDEVTIGWLNGDGSWSIYDGWMCVSADEISAWIPLPKVYKPSVIENCLREKRYE